MTNSDCGLSIERPSEFGRPAGASFEAGVTRIAFSEADKAARAWLMQLMRDVGLTIRIDRAGNIFGRPAGQQTPSICSLVPTLIPYLTAGTSTVMLEFSALWR